jgi:hypothetical protein
MAITKCPFGKVLPNPRRLAALNPFEIPGNLALNLNPKMLSQKISDMCDLSHRALQSRPSIMVSKWWFLAYNSKKGKAVRSYASN